MCGLAGIISKNSRNYRIEIEQMLNSISHRGPDSSGKIIKDNFIFGFNRLAIVGLNNGEQPIQNKDGTLTLICNGEIYNHKELKKDLIQKGYQFKTESDVEVILHLYADNNSKFLENVKGQFAFAIFNENNNKLILGRDRTGICPLFYTIKDNELFFASEIKALFKVPYVKREFSPQNIYDMISYWSVVPPNTVFKDIYQICPGEIITWENYNLKKRKYWQLQFNDEYSNQSFPDLKEMIYNQLEISVKRHLDADVPVGLYLSGGIDSSILALIAAKVHGNDLNTFSIGFEDKNYDESYFQHLLSKELGVRHHHFDFKYKDIAEYFPEVVRHAETILFRCAPVPLFCLSKEVNKFGYKTVMSGEGADEIFWGYDTFRELFIRLMWSRNPESSWRPEQLQKIFSYFEQYKNDRYFNFLKAFYKKTLNNTEDPFYSHLPRWSTNKSNCGLINSTHLDNISESDSRNKILDILPDDFQAWDSFQKCQAIEMITLLNGYLLSSQGDRMIMSHSVEGRFPFLDKDVLELSSKIPSKWKCKGLNDKYILREAFKHELPESIYKRPKFAYRAPDMKSFFGANEPSYLNELFSEAYTKDVAVFDPKKVQLIYKKGNNSDLDKISTKDNMAFTIILSTHLLYSEFIK